MKELNQTKHNILQMYEFSKCNFIYIFVEKKHVIPLTIVNTLSETWASLKNLIIDRRPADAVEKC